MRNFQLPGRSPVIAPQAMVSTSHPLSSSAALTILQKGGNAVDAALAAASVQCVVEPHSTSIGGDCFCLYAPADSDNIIALNGSGRAPKGLSAEWLIDNGYSSLPQQSPHAVTMPTAVDAWLTLNRDYGRLPIGDIFESAIGYARNGHPVGQRVAFDFSSCLELLKGDLDAANVFLHAGKTLPMGFHYKQPELAKTLEAIADNGRDGFYQGWVAEDMLTKLQQLGGRQTQEDLDAAISDYVTPIKTRYQGYDIWECPPNGQGVIALLLINIMAGIDRFGDDPINVERIHHEIEAGRLAYRDRALYLGDPHFSNQPVDALLSTDYAGELRNAINPQKVLSSLPKFTLPKHKSTVYISVVDKDRNACSLINTVYHSFGAGLMAPKSGVLFQCRGLGFQIEPGHPNCIEPGKRPLHTIIPGMVKKNSKTIMPFGVMGGEYQAFGHMQFLTRMMDYGLDVQAAQDCPRFFPDPFSDNVEIEAPISDDICRALQNRGHNIVRAKKPIGGAQAIWIDEQTNMLSGGSDPRKDGMAIGY